jgi:hypothetical protein
MNANDQLLAGVALVDQARERLAQLSVGSVLKACLYFLRREPNDGPDWYKRAPFVTFMMIKWAAELCDASVARRGGTDADFDFIQQSIWEATSKLVRPTRPSIFMRRMAFQQIWYQRSFEVGAIPRQALIFGELMAESPLVREFVAAAGIEPHDFIRQLARMACQMGEFLGLPALTQLRPEPRHEDARDWPLLSQFLVVDLTELHRRISALAQYGTPREVEL